MIKLLKIKKKGLTAIEAVMAILILFIGMQGFTMLLIRSWQQNSYIIELGQSAMAVSQGLNRLIGYVRAAKQADNGAYPVQIVDDNELTFFSDYDKDGKTERLHIYKTGPTIFMGIREPSVSMPIVYASGDEETVIIAERIVNEMDVPIFYYYNQDYPSDTVNNPLITPAAVSDVRLVKIFFKINIDPNHAPDNVEMQSFVEMRNLNDYNQNQ